MKFRFNFNLEVWVDGIEIDAKDYDSAVEELYKMAVKEYFEEGYDRNSHISDVEGEVIEKTIKVKAYDIEYDVEEDDYENPEEYIEVINSLPSELVFEITLDPTDDEEELIADEITYKTDWLVKNFRYTIIEEY